MKQTNHIIQENPNIPSAVNNKLKILKAAAFEGRLSEALYLNELQIKILEANGFTIYRFRLRQNLSHCYCFVVWKDAIADIHIQLPDSTLSLAQALYVQAKKIELNQQQYA